MKIIFLIMVLVVSGNLYAEEGDPFWVAGLASGTCGEFISDRGWDDYPQYYGYVNGFITGYRYGEGSSFAARVNTNDMLLWVKNYCDDHPLEPLISALVKLVKELKNK